MKKTVLLIMLALGFSTLETNAKEISYLEEIQQLGDVAGQGLACRARKYQQYELLARAILVTKSPNDKMQQQAMIVYNEKKIDSMSKIFASNYEGCDQIVYNFNRQKIFKSVLYADGKIKLYDGTLLTPRKLYDASSLYKKDPEIYDKALDTYKKAVANAQKNKKNRPRIEFHDANYNRYANQFN